jgi:predicted DNA-binding transcriptional regulator AlpA
MSPPQPAPTGRTIRRQQLREIVPLADTTIYDMKQRGDFPQRFYLTCRCVVLGSRRSQGLGRNATRGLQSESHQSRAVA